ncbi:MAG: hypothetical protein ACLPKB_29850 [Xanthobacteraceae bacterium]
MNEASPKLGFCASIIAFIAVVGYGVAQILQVLKIVNYPLSDILIYGFSLCISVPFLIAVLALHDTVDSRQRLWARGALLFGVMYVTYVVLMYTVQLSVVIPKSMHSPSSDVLGVAPQTLFWDIDALGYISMGISTLFAALALPRTESGVWARRFLLSNAIITPVIAFIYFYPHFSLGVLLLGLPWLITAPGSLVALALYFRTIRSATGSGGAPSDELARHTSAA